MAKRGLVNFMIHESESRRRIRIIIANDSPTKRAFLWDLTGSRPATIEMKTMLSIPRTISSAVSVVSAIHICGSKIQSIFSSFGLNRVEIHECLDVSKQLNSSPGERIAESSPVWTLIQNRFRQNFHGTKRVCLC